MHTLPQILKIRSIFRVDFFKVIYNNAVQISKENIGIGILASEKSRRMDKNKAFLQIEGLSFIEHTCKEFDSFGQIYISANNKDSYKDLGFTVVQDEHHGVGPMEGIYQILKESKYEYNFICSVDMPFLKCEFLEYLISKIDEENDCYVFEDEKRTHPTCAVYSKSLISLIEKLINEKKYCLLEIFDQSNTKYIPYPEGQLDKKMLVNINTQQDYESLCNN